MARRYERRAANLASGDDAEVAATAPVVGDDLSADDAVRAEQEDRDADG